MTTHLDDDLLARWALGDEAPDGPAADHLQSCQRCAGSLAELRQVLDAAGDLPRLESPPAEVWSRITDELSLDPDRAEPTVIPLPDARRTPNASVRRFRGRALVAAAAVAAVLGAGVGVGATLIVQDDEKPTVQAVVPLSALEGRSGTGTADLLKAASGEQLKVTASGLAAAAGYYEVWMINTDGKRMVSLGVLDPSSAGTFQLPAQLIAQGYRIVDISLEPDDGNPEHSRNSIIRGTLPA